MPFIKGQSGNVRGRLPGTGYTSAEKLFLADAKRLAAKHGEAAIETLVEIMQDKASPAAARVACAQAILDRGFGKPTQVIEANVNVWEQMDYNELRTFVSDRLARISAGSGTSGDDGVGDDVRGEIIDIHPTSVETH